MTYADLQYEFARYGFTYTPLTEQQYDRLAGQGFTLDELYSIGCDLAAGFSLADAILANHDKGLIQA